MTIRQILKGTSNESYTLQLQHNKKISEYVYVIEKLYPHPPLTPILLSDFYVDEI